MPVSAPISHNYATEPGFSFRIGKQGLSSSSMVHMPFIVCLNGKLLSLSGFTKISTNILNTTVLHTSVSFSRLLSNLSCDRLRR